MRTEISILVKLTCEQRDAILGYGDNFNTAYKVWSSLTDLEGEFSQPLVKTLWGPDAKETNHIALGIQDIRHPDIDGIEVEPCEHYAVMIDWRVREND